MDFKAELQKAKEAAWVGKEVSEAVETASYECGVQETEIRLADELAKVYRDYYKKVWAKALSRARVPTTFEWRSAENIFYPEDIREIPVMLHSPATLALPSLEKPFTTQALLPLIEVSKGAGKTGDQGQGTEVAKGKEAVWEGH